MITITTALRFDYTIYFLKIQNYDDINKTGKRKTCNRALQSR